MANSEILGIGDMKANFAKVKEDMGLRVSRRMVASAGSVLKAKAKAIAISNGSKRTGAMVNNVVIKRETQAPAGTTQYNLGVRHGGMLSKKVRETSKFLAVSRAGRIVTRYQNDPYYWKWVEQGHKIVGRADPGDKSYTTTTYLTRLRNGKLAVRTRERANSGLRARRAAATGEVAAKPFIGPALEQGKAEAIEAMGKELQKSLEKFGTK